MECQTHVLMPLPSEMETLAPRMCCVLVQSLERRDARMLTSSRLWLIVGDIQALQQSVGCDNADDNDNGINQFWCMY